MSKKIGVLIGSLRQESFTRKLAGYMIKQFPDDFELRVIDIDLPLYNQDLEEDGKEPAAWGRFREEVAEMDGFLFLTPEYNRSMPAVLKNALDVGSRPHGKSVWNGKPAAIVSNSPGRVGGFGANHHLRQPLTFLNVYVMQQPEAYIGDVVNLLGPNGDVPDEANQKFLQSIIDAYVDWVNRF